MQRKPQKFLAWLFISMIGSGLICLLIEIVATNAELEVFPDPIVTLCHLLLWTVVAVMIYKGERS